MHYRPHFEQLEHRILLSRDLEIGGTEVFSFRDADGDQITIRISGSAGRALLMENMLDGVGNNDGILDEGEYLGAVVIKDASPDFSLIFEAIPTGDGLIQLGEITAISQVIHSVFTLGSADFELTSFIGQGFTTGGGLRVDSLQNRITLASLDGNTTIDIRKDLAGEIIIKDDLAGELYVGGEWTGRLIVGENFNGTIIAGSNVSGNIQIIGNFNGMAAIAGDTLGRWLVVGSLNGQIQAGGSVSYLEVVRSLTGTVEAGHQVWIEVGYAVSPAGAIRGRDVIAYVKDNFWGDIYGTERVYLHVGSSLTQTARAKSDGPLIVVYGTQIMEGSQLLAQSPTIRYRPHYSQGTIITHVPYVITVPGLYRLASHLIFGDASGNAIEVRASNVTIDMQGFALVNTAGPTTFAIGIKGTELDNVAVLNGTIRGFHTALLLDGIWASRYRVEGVRAENNWFWGIRVTGAQTILRNNVVLDTGGIAVPEWEIIVAMKAAGPNSLVENNIVSGVVRSIYNKEWVGLHVDQALGARVLNNIFATRQPEVISWGIWLNGRPWADGSQTTARLEGNIFVNLATAATFADRATGSYSFNVLLDIPAAINHGILEVPRPENDGNNFRFDMLLSPDAAQQLSELRRNYGFRFYGSLFPLFYYNWAGLNEKWFLDRKDQWYALLPDGRLYKWDGNSRSLGSSLLIEWVDPDVYRDPDLLFSAAILLSEQTKDQLSQLRRDYAFWFSGNFYRGVYGQHEKWFLDRLGHWFTLTPDGTLYQWHGIPGQLGSQIAQLDPLVFDDPNLLFQAELQLPQILLDQLAQLQLNYGFNFSGNFYQDVYGQNEKWFLDRQGKWFALTPQGMLYQWNEQSGQLGQQIAQLDPLVFDDPNLLFQAEVQLSQTLLDQLAQLRLDYGFHFSGNYYRNSYGHNEKWFLDRQGNWFAITPTGSLYQWNEVSGQLGQQIDQLDSRVFDNPHHLFQAAVMFSEQAQQQLSQLRMDHGFRFHLSYYENWAGQNEKWFIDRQGTWYAILPDGKLLRYNGHSLASSELLVILAPVVYDDPQLLLQVNLFLSQQTLDLAEQLRRVYGFTFSAEYYFGEGMWLRDRYGRWYALMRDGRLYQYDGTSLTTSPLIKQVDPIIFDVPESFLAG